MQSLSKHGGKGLCTRPFDKLRVTGRLLEFVMLNEVKHLLFTMHLAE
jgi:hypothetical protein